MSLTTKEKIEFLWTIRVASVMPHPWNVVILVLIYLVGENLVR